MRNESEGDPGAGTAMTAGRGAVRPWCLPECDRLDGHDGRDPGACMKGAAELTPGPLDLVHRHPDIPVHVAMRRKPEGWTGR